MEHAEKVIARLKECADEMDNIKEAPTDMEALYEKLKKIDINLI